MGQHAVAATAFGGKVLPDICQAATGHAHRLEALHNRGQVHGLLSASGLHLLHLMQDRQHRADEFRVVLRRHVPLIEDPRFKHLLEQVYVVARMLADVFKDLDERVKLLGCQLKVADVLSQRLLQSGLLPRIDPPKGCLRGVIRVSARHGRLLPLRLLVLHTHALRQGHDSFICHDSPFQFLPVAARAARRERTR